MEHINRLLDYMIVEDPEERRYADQILVLLQDTIRLVQKEFVPIAKDIPAPCQYCGEGFYRLKVDGSATSVHNFGLNSVGGNEWRVFVCDACGHVQFFRIDQARRKEWWE